MGVGCNVLLFAGWGLCRVAAAKDRYRSVAVRLLPVAASIYVAEDLIVSAVFADNVNDVFEWRAATREDISLFLRKQAVISHNGLRIRKQLLFIGDVDDAYIPRNRGNAV